MKRNILPVSGTVLAASSAAKLRHCVLIFSKCQYEHTCLGCCCTQFRSRDNRAWVSRICLLAKCSGKRRLAPFTFSRINSEHDINAWRNNLLTVRASHRESVLSAEHVNSVFEYGRNTILFTESAWPRRVCRQRSLWGILINFLSAFKRLVYCIGLQYRKLSVVKIHTNLSGAP